MGGAQQRIESTLIKADKVYKYLKQIEAIKIHKTTQYKQVGKNREKNKDEINHKLSGFIIGVLLYHKNVINHKVS